MFIVFQVREGTRLGRLSLLATQCCNLAYSFYLTGIWCYKIILELSSTISILTENTAVHYILIAIPVLLIVWFYYIFIRRFFKLIKANA